MDKNKIRSVFAYIDLSFMVRNAIPTSDTIRDEILQISKRDDFDWITHETAEAIAQEYESYRGVSKEVADVLLAEEKWEPWFKSQKGKLDLYYWNRYRWYLQSRGIFSPQVMATFDEETDQIVDYLQDPVHGESWDRRGLVMGHVQSGKTGNYTGVICKAADAGYKVIVVIAGLNNNLRKQTQHRMDLGFIGFETKSQNSTSKEIIGVGIKSTERLPASFTTTVSDFRLSAANTMKIPLGALKEPAVIVVKKNSRVMKSLLDYLRSINTKLGGRIPEPLLIIDDEADNASINIKYGKDEISAINGRIRELMELFKKSSYVGYTATPFANVLIDPDAIEDKHGLELFPKDFILSLNPAGNYIGPEQVFGGAEAYPGLRTITDHQQFLPVRHKKDHYLPDLPPSLKKAVRQFVISRAIKIWREDDSHSSMLVNASYLNAVQEQIKAKIQSEMNSIQASLENYHKSGLQKALKDSEIKRLFELVDEDYSLSAQGISDKDMLALLHLSASQIQTRVINSQSAEALNYDEYKNHFLNVIAIGGYSLSRGLTLEGLMISYYLRNTEMTDTLLQMGRWFGYRDGYEDLCRIWMRDVSIGDFEDAQIATKELRDEFRNLKLSGGTPKDFGLRVSTHMSNLRITSKDKMGKSYELDLSYGGRHVQTGVLSSKLTEIIENKKSAKNLIDQISKGDMDAHFKKVQSPFGYLATSVSVDLIIEFLIGYRYNAKSPESNPQNLLDYIGPRSYDELKLWDVFIVNLQKPEKGGRDNYIGLEINSSSRGLESDKLTDLSSSYDYQTDIPFNRRRVGVGGQTIVGLSDSEIAAAESNFANDPDKAKSVSDKYYRAVRSKPLLLLHTIKVDHPEFKSLQPVLAWEISFPRTQNTETTKFIVNQVYYRNFMQEAQDAADEEDYDDK